MRVSEEGIEFIARWEGFSSQIYRDAGGYPTIGYGHLLQEGEEHHFRNGITESQALDLLIEDIKSAERAVNRLISAPLSQNQFDALVSFTFNVGEGNLRASTLRQRLNRRDYQAVPVQMSRWVYSGGSKIKGLERRRQAEADLFMA